MSFVWYLATLRWKPIPLIPLEDRLSILPDSILCHILSFLPTKQSAATSILSKRWNSLWLSVLTLDLVPKNLSDLETFHSVILLRDIKVPIQTLRLKCNGLISIYHDPMPIIKNYCNHINSLIKAATQRGLETLQLDMRLSPLGGQLASNIFSCKTLNVLELRHVAILMEDFHGINTSPLKTLRLDHVYFRCPTHIINFLSSFPTLEELQTNDVDVQNFTPETEINKCLPNLMRARLSDTVVIPLFLLSRALFLTIKLTSTHLMPIEDTWSQVPTFHNLTKMELLFKLDSKKKCEWILEMLKQSPKLQHLIIDEKEKSRFYKNRFYDHNWTWSEPDVVPECLSSQLRTCLIRNSRDWKCVLLFAEYIIRNSKVLHTMTIQNSGILDSKAKSLMLQKLSQCPRSCAIIFY